MSDYGRKRLMYIVFIGHALSGGFTLVFINQTNWSSQYLWIANVYNLFGGYPAIRVALYGYIGDVSNNRERTTLLSILNGFGRAVFPLADFFSGQMFHVIIYLTIPIDLALCKILHLFTVLWILYSLQYLFWHDSSWPNLYNIYS